MLMSARMIPMAVRRIRLSRTTMVRGANEFRT